MALLISLCGVSMLKFLLDNQASIGKYLSMNLTISQKAVVHNTFVIERSYAVPPERVFAALKDPAKKRRWFAEGDNHEVETFEMDFQVGGKERARFRIRKGGPYEGAVFNNDGVYQDIVADRRVVMAYTMGLGGQHISASLITFELLPSDKGTDLILTHQGAFFEGADGPQMREGGWRRLLDTLATELAKETGGGA
jgi:uncharacterized protein YndB with AHSA1/START domain